LTLHAADTSVRAILRRLGLGRLGGERASALYDWKYVEFLRGDPQSARNGAGYHLRIARLPPGEIANLSAALPYLHAAELLTILPDPIAADVLEAMPPERQLQVFEELEKKQGTRLLALMAPDTAADLVGRLRNGEARVYQEQQPPGRGEKVVELLRYPEDTVGGIMTNDVVFVASDQSVGAARETLRERLQNPDFVYLVYVVDNAETKHLRGVVSLRELIIADDNYRVEEIMNPYVATVGALDSADAASYRLLRSHLPAMPVVGREGVLIGIITIDEAVSQVAPAGWRAQAPRVFS
jgi:Mg/Co/Ni transporter MgtE